MIEDAPFRLLRGILLIGATVALQSGAHMLLLRMLGHRRQRQAQHRHTLPQVGVSVIVVVVLISGHLLQAAVWALDYLYRAEFANFAQAMYFSLASFTTVGADGLDLRPHDRLMGAIEAATGVMMFGWSTAILVTLLERATPGGAR